jgi:arylsulfatase A-like enzyme
MASSYNDSPGVIEPGSICNEIISNLDWLPTLVAAAGDADVKGKLLPLECAGAAYTRDECLARAYEERTQSIASADRSRRPRAGCRRHCGKISHMGVVAPTAGAGSGSHGEALPQ